MERRITQLDVAKVLGIHRTTVSLVFKNHPSIPEETRARVLACAKKMGYAPDPMLSSLAAYRSRIRPKAFQGTLVWLVNPSGDIPWNSIPAFCDYHKGAESRALEYGFKLEIFELKKGGISNERLASIFRARNIAGLLLPPQARANLEIDFAWDDFSAVTFGYSLSKPQLHMVTATQFRAMVQTMRRLKQLGYERIGFYFATSFNERTDHNYLAGYLVETHGSKVFIPPLFSMEGSHQAPREWYEKYQPEKLLPSDEFLKKFSQWYEKYQPDAIVTGDRNILVLLRSLKIKVPEMLGVACPMLEKEQLQQPPRLAGVYEDSFHIGEIAMDFLVSMIHRGERGIPACPQRIHVEGTWVEGDTLREQKIAGKLKRPAKK